MMVPRVFAGSSPPRLGSIRPYDEKKSVSVNTRAISSRSKSRSPSPSKTSKPSRRPTEKAPDSLIVPEKNIRSQLNQRNASPQRPQQTPIQTPAKRESAQDILSATAIPIRRRPKRRAAQRLPDGDHVVNFSTWLQDDLRHVGNSPSSSYSAQFDGLFGSIDGCVDNVDMFVGSEGLDADILRTRSMSTESMPSLASPDESSLADTSNASPFSSRSPSYRKLRYIASSEDCAAEHPLLPDDEQEGDSTPELVLSPTPTKARAEGTRRASTFKSTLTASLRAIKSAAQSVSNYATPLNEADMFSTAFDIRPSLTDDRRPPPDAGPPSPALRRYLNPNRTAPPDSPAQLHFWTEFRSYSKPQTLQVPPLDRSRTKKKQTKFPSADDANTSRLPPIVPLATCIPSAVRTAHASSPPIWLAPDGTPANKQTATPLWSAELNPTSGPLKQREPRENCDFLRVFVCEMEMKRAGKLKMTAAGHARMWLPPVSEERGKRLKLTGKDRWAVWTRTEDGRGVVRVV